MSTLKVLNSYFFFFFSNSEIAETPKTLKQVDAIDLYCTVLFCPKCFMNEVKGKTCCFFLFQTPVNIKKVEILNFYKCFLPWLHNSLSVNFCMKDHIHYFLAFIFSW